MADAQIAPEEALGGMAEESAPVLETVLRMNLDTLESCSLDERTYWLVRLAALVAMDAPPASYLVNLAAAGEAGVTAEDAQGVLVAIAPITGTARITAAAGNVLRGFGLAAAFAGADS
jgi:alkylhydroperoxidase/carboxymuconolactone decarboxylase family protein YurZ